MYAVIKTGGKQYKVAAGEKIKIEQIAADVGQEIVIDQVLAVGNGAELKVGAPLVAGATVSATVLAHGRHDKVRIFKMRRRKHYQKHGGHRQNYTELQIGAPLVSGASVVAKVVAHGKHDKVRIFKMRRRKHYQKRQGHRQQFTELQIGDIAG